jgi:hemerythrin-like domain-containing protein
MEQDDMAEIRDLDIAKRLRREHAMLRQITASLKAVADRVPEQDQEAWFDNLQAQYEQFRAHMTKRIALEEVGGFMRAVEDRRPSLAPQIEHLRHEHERILGRINAVHRELAKLESVDTEALDDCRLRIQLILSEVAQHERSENLLVGFVFTQDIGGEE